MRVASFLCTRRQGRWRVRTSAGPVSGAQYPAGSAHARPRRSAAVAASTGTVTGCGAPATAQSGSLRPLPVTVQTMRLARVDLALARRP